MGWGLYEQNSTLRMNMERKDRLARHQLGAPVIKSKAEPISDIRANRDRTRRRAGLRIGRESWRSLKAALRARQPYKGCIQHSDRGSQYASTASPYFANVPPENGATLRSSEIQPRSSRRISRDSWTRMARLSRYEATLWRQAGRILLALDALDRRKPLERAHHIWPRGMDRARNLGDWPDAKSNGRTRQRKRRLSSYGRSPFHQSRAPGTNAGAAD